MTLRLTPWVQQVRAATPYGYQPEYLTHDNDAIFKGSLLQEFLSNAEITPKHIAPRSPWQNGICERLIGNVRRELLDRIIPLNQRRLERLLADYVNYYNNVRTHQSLGGESPVKGVSPPETKGKDTALSATPILCGLYHGYEKVA